MKHDDVSSGHRHERLQGLLHDELGALLRDDVSDPTLTGVHVTAVVLSVDYRHARVHFALEPGSADHARVERALEKVTPYLRAQLAVAIDIKRVPDLRFVFDAVAAPLD